MKRNKETSERYWLICCMVFYLLANICSYIFVKEFGFYIALSIIALDYPLKVLVITTILRVRGYIQEKRYAGLVLEGFKISRLLQKIWNDTTRTTQNSSARSKKSR